MVVGWLFYLTAKKAWMLVSTGKQPEDRWLKVLSEVFYIVSL